MVPTLACSSFYLLPLLLILLLRAYLSIHTCLNETFYTHKNGVWTHASSLTKIHNWVWVLNQKQKKCGGETGEPRTVQIVLLHLLNSYIVVFHCNHLLKFIRCQFIRVVLSSFISVIFQQISIIRSLFHIWHIFGKSNTL